MRYQADEWVNCMGNFLPYPQSSGVQIKLWDLSTPTGELVPLDDNSCYQVGDIGVWKWSSSGISTQPTQYTEYLYRMTDPMTGLAHTGKFILHGYEERHGYQGAVWIDVAGGSSGTAYPKGTSSDPVNNISDARTIADNYGYKIFHIRGEITLDESYDNWQFLGWSQCSVDIVNLNGQSINGCYFERVTISGTAESGDIFDGTDCLIKNVNNLLGSYCGCLFQGTITFDAGSSTALSCGFQGTAGVAPTFDFTNNGSNAQFDACAGDIIIVNIDNSTQVVEFAFISGSITIESNCTDGIIEIHGVAKVTDNSGSSCDVIRDAQLPYATFQSELAEYDIEGTAGHSLFMTAYRGEVWVNTTGKEISSITTKKARFIPAGSHFTWQGINTAGATQDYYCWFRRDGEGSDPGAPGIGFVCDINDNDPGPEDVEEDVAYLILAAINGSSQADYYRAKVPVTSLVAWTVQIQCRGDGNITDINQQDCTMQVKTLLQGTADVGYTGTAFPIGTPYKPVDNITDALAIANAVGTVRFACLGQIWLDQSIDLTMWRSQTDDYQGALLDFMNEDAEFCHFEWMTLTGQTTNKHFTSQNCWMTDLYDVNTLFRNGQIWGKVTVGAQFKGTGVACPNVFGAYVDMQSLVNQVALVDFNGVCTFQNSAPGGVLAVTGFYKITLSAVGHTNLSIAILYFGGVGTVEYAPGFDPAQEPGRWVGSEFVDATLPSSVWDEKWTDHQITNTFGETFTQIIVYLVSTLNPQIISIQAKIDIIDTNIDEIEAIIRRVLGLVHENIVTENTYDASNKHTGYIAYVYDSKTNADLHDKSTGLLYTYKMTVTYDSEDNPTILKVTKE